MFDPTQLNIDALVLHLKLNYQRNYGNQNQAAIALISRIARQVLSILSESNAPYHTVEHTLLVTWVGQAILQGKQLRDRNVTAQDWLNFTVALLCHDIGYVQGVCPGDRSAARRYVINAAGTTVPLQPGCTDASLTPYHVDRSQLFVSAHLGNAGLIEPAAVNAMIELTRFPVPAGDRYTETLSYGGLCRAADLLGQLSDRRYLQKLPALFQEFAEIGMDRQLGYQHADELRASYPRFFWDIVYPYICDSEPYLAMTKAGRQVIASLYANLYIVQREQQQQEIRVSRALALSGATTWS
ncbi:metal-dependent phosphohydrolase [Almyronema epifaneia]|uniref:Metal-dependent phosphohydrolase n=1 Tax=Almyronema epifaneia S1 TaxID=2991925 RepID=A0ABW6II53_9CYAN